MAEKNLVLVVDDYSNTRDFMREMLESDGYEVLDVEDGDIALKQIESIEIDRVRAIFLDIMMPGMNGLDVLVALKAHARTQNIPVILITTSDMGEELIRGYNLGAEYFLPKPFTKEQVQFGLSMVS